MNKRGYYQDPRIAAEYDRLRFGGHAGRWVDTREREAVCSLIDGSAKVILDAPCGTGRMLEVLDRRGGRVPVAIGMDLSEPMMRQASWRLAGHKGRLIVGDVYALPFKLGAFDVALCLRFAVHCRDVAPVLSGLREVVRPGGSIVFDTQRRSWRARLPVLRALFGGPLHIHGDQEVAQVVSALGMRVTAARSRFLFSTLLYRVLPRWCLKILAEVEARVPDRYRHKVYWKVTR